MKADFPQPCAMGDDIAKGDDIVPHKGSFIHRRCAPGQDDVQPKKRATAKKPAPVVEVVDTKAPAPRDPGMLYEIPDIPASGLLLPNLDEDTYHAHRGSLSSTGAKLIRKAPALFEYEQTHPVFKKEFDYGSAAHKYVLGTGPEIVELVATYADGRKKTATDRRSPSVAEHEKEIRAAGKLPMMAKDHERVKVQAEALKSHDLAMQLLAKGDPEVSAFRVDDETGVMRRGRFDLLRKRVLIDFKTAVNASDRALRKVALENGWYQQAAYYLDLARDLDYDIDRMYFVCQEKTPPFLPNVIVLDHRAVELGRRHNREALQMYRDCVEAGIWPGYPTYDPNGEVKVISLPGYAFIEEES